MQYTHDDVQDALSALVDEGLLEMGVTEDGEAIFWPTSRGIEELEMHVLRQRIEDEVG